MFLPNVSHLDILILSKLPSFGKQTAHLGDQLLPLNPPFHFGFALVLTC